MKRQYLPLLAIVATSLVTVAAIRHAGPERRWESDRVAAEVRVLNLVNQMNLTAQELDLILPLARKDVAERAELERRRDEAEPALMEAAKALREELRDGFHTTPQSEDAWNRVHGRLLDAFLDYKQNRDRRITEVQQILTPNQVALVAHFTPCVVPIADIKDPARVGQASASSVIERALDRARQMPDEFFEGSRERLRERLAEKLRLHYSYDEIPAKVKEFETAVLEVRGMSEVEFQAKKVEIAERLAPLDAVAAGPELRMRIGEFFLSPEASGVLEQKRAAMAAASTPSK